MTYHRIPSMFRLTAGAIAIAASACSSSVELANSDADATAKTFRSAADKAVVYVVQDGGVGSYRAYFRVHLDGRLVATLSGRTCSRLEVMPSQYTVMVASADNQKLLPIAAKAGELLFVGVNSAYGWSDVIKVNELRILSNDDGRAAVLSASLAAELSSAPK